MFRPFARLRRRDRAAADQLQLALQRYEALVGQGMSPRQARIEAAGGAQGEPAALFRLAMGVEAARAAAPEPDFVGMVEQRLREAAARPQTVLRLQPARARRPALVPALAGFMSVLFIAVALTRGAFISLPGDPLYQVKELGRGARLTAVSGRSEALTRVGFASDRFAEVDTLVRKARAHDVLGTTDKPVASGPADFIRDPRLVKLIASTLRKAERDLTVAAKVLLAERAPDRPALAKLEVVAHHGRATASNVAPVLPTSVQTPVIQTAVTLHTIEMEAAAEGAKIDALPGENPCASPTPTPTASPSPSPTPSPTTSPKPSPTPAAKQASASPSPKATASAKPTSSPTPSPSPTPTPTPTPSPTPCVSPAPSPSASPSRSPAASAAPSATARPTATPEPAETELPVTQETYTPSPTPSPSTGEEPAASPSSDDADRSRVSCSYFRYFGVC